MKFKVKKKRKAPEAKKSYWEQLQEFPNEEATRAALRAIPDDMAEALQLEPAMFLIATTRLAGLMSHWSTRMAYAKGRFSAAKHAREIGLEAMKSDNRQILRRIYEKVTEPMISERAKASEEYARLALAEVEAEAEFLRIKGLVDTIATKRESLRIISFYLKPEMDMASGSYTVPDLSQITQPSVLESLAAKAQEKMDEKVKKLPREKGRDR